MIHDPLIAVGDILREIAFLEAIAKSKTLDTFKADPTTFRAAAYSVQIISEAVRHLPDDWLSEYSQEPWAAIRATGNKIRHEYFRLDDAILWQIVTVHGPALKPIMKELITKHSTK